MECISHSITIQYQTGLGVFPFWRNLFWRESAGCFGEISVLSCRSSFLKIHAIGCNSRSQWTLQLCFRQCVVISQQSLFVRCISCSIHTSKTESRMSILSVKYEFELFFPPCFLWRNRRHFRQICQQNPDPSYTSKWREIPLYIPLYIKEGFIVSHPYFVYCQASPVSSSKFVVR